MASEIDRLRERLHIIEGVSKVLDDGGIALAMEVERCADRGEAVDLVMKFWRLSEEQAMHALDMPFGSGTKLAKSDLRIELAELKERIEELDS